jgi:hypothetical protein
MCLTHLKRFLIGNCGIVAVFTLAVGGDADETGPVISSGVFVDADSTEATLELFCEGEEAGATMDATTWLLKPPHLQPQQRQQSALKSDDSWAHVRPFFLSAKSNAPLTPAEVRSANHQLSSI